MPKTYQPKTDRKNRSTKPQVIPQQFKAGFFASLDGRTDLAKTPCATAEPSSVSSAFLAFSSGQ